MTGSAKIYIVELNDLYHSKNTIGVIESKGERTGVYWVLVGNSEGKRPLGRLKHKSENNIKMDL